MKLNNIPLELDNRIFDIANIKTVITADEKDVGKMGYFANSIHLFKNLEGLDGIKYGKLIYLSDLDYGGDKSDKCFVCSNQWAYRYFIPEDALKPEEPEKKYRAFTLNEFLERYKIGDTVTFRLKKGEHVPEEECRVEYTRLITGYETLPENRDIPGKSSILLGGCPPTSLARLFEFYELENEYYFPTVWQPFGVIEDD